MNVSRPPDRHGSPLRPSTLSPRSSPSRAGHAVALSFQSQLQQASTSSSEPWRPPTLTGTSSDAVVSPRSPLQLSNSTKNSLLGGSDAISPPHADREFPVARVDPWPLSLLPMTSPRRVLPSKLVHSSYRSDQDDAVSSQRPPPPLVLPTDVSHRPDTYELPTTATTSPRKQRQTQARYKARVIDESKLQSVLLQELQAFLVSELNKIEASTDCGVNPEDRAESSTSLRRLQVYRELFQRLIEAFSVYSPLLSLVRDEYERVISVLRARTEQLPRLRSQLQTLETRCLQEISLHSLEERSRVLTLKKQLKNTQGRLAALAAQNSGLRSQIGGLERDVARLEARSDGLKLSNHTLVSSIQRHDETLQQVHQRSVDEGLALQQITQKYYHACDEITELKKTIANLEDKVDGDQVAADKATIALLTTELQDLRYSQHGEKTSAMSSGVDCTGIRAQSALNSAVVRAFHAVGVPMTLPALLESVISGLPTGEEARRDGDLEFGINKTAQAIQHKLRQFRQQQSALSTPHTAVDTSTVPSEAVVFLTEPPEQVISSVPGIESSSEPVNVLNTLFVPVQDYLPCLGVSSTVPEHLQFDGVVRNLHLSLKAVNHLMHKIWDLQDEIAKARARSISTTSTELHSNSRNKELDPRLRSRSLHLPPLRAVLVNFLHRSCASKTEMAETAYNLVAALSRFSTSSSDCRLFQLVLDREAPDDSRHDRDREISALHDALVVSDRERQSGFQSSSSDTSEIEEFDVPPGFVSVSEVIRSLRLLFPWKPDSALAQLHRALLQEARGRRFVDYAALLRHQTHSPKQSKSKSTTREATSRFVECLKSQYIDDIVDYRRYLQHQIAQELTRAAQPGTEGLERPATTVADGDPPQQTSLSAGVGADGAHMISLRTLRECIQRGDPAKTAFDIAAILSAVSGLSVTQILTQDDSRVDGRRAIACLPTLLVRPSGRFPRSTVLVD